MEAKSLKPYFIVIGLMGLTSLLLAFSVDVRMVDEAGIKVQLPEKIGDWRGQDILYCQSKLCDREYQADQLGGSSVCPACGSPLGPMSIAEKEMLPDDTILVKKVYEDPYGQKVFVSIVLSGKERVSIHRPQICLVGQGNEIVKSSVLEVPLENREPLHVMLLDMIRRATAPDRREVEWKHYYAYWFVGKNRETPYHLQRMIWMATDRIFHNVSHRWAYISVSGMRTENPEEYRSQVKNFVRQLYPEILLTPRG